MEKIAIKRITRHLTFVVEWISMNLNLDGWFVCDSLLYHLKSFCFLYYVFFDFLCLLQWFDLECWWSRNSEKRVSAVAVSKDEQYVCFADKFGVVWIVDLVGVAENQHVSNKKAVALFGHYCSIITSLVCSSLLPSAHKFTTFICYISTNLHMINFLCFAGVLAWWTVHSQRWPRFQNSCNNTNFHTFAWIFRP